MDLALNNLQRLICHKTQQTKLISKFELQLHYYIHFQTNTLRKAMNPLISQSYGLDNTTTVILQE